MHVPKWIDNLYWISCTTWMNAFLQFWKCKILAFVYYFFCSMSSYQKRMQTTNIKANSLVRFLIFDVICSSYLSFRRSRRDFCILSLKYLNVMSYLKIPHFKEGYMYVVWCDRAILPLYSKIFFQQTSITAPNEGTQTSTCFFFYKNFKNIKCCKKKVKELQHCSKTLFGWKKTQL